MFPSQIAIHPEVAEALSAGRAVVALESALVTHGLPAPLNLETARAAEAAIRAAGAVPATIAVWRGLPTVGLGPDQLAALANDRAARKAARRDLAAAAVAGASAGTTVSATMDLAWRAGIRVLATGGIGGVHRGSERTGDVSADLWELTRTPVAVVCSGAKGLLDLPRTLEYLETLSVPVLGYATDRFPALWSADSGLPVSARVDTAAEAAAVLSAHWGLGGSGIVLAQPPPAGVALELSEVGPLLEAAYRQAESLGVRGPAVTPFLLGRLAGATGGRTVAANRALIVANADLAGRVAAALTACQQSS